MVFFGDTPQASTEGGITDISKAAEQADTATHSTLFSDSIYQGK